MHNDILAEFPTLADQTSAIDQAFGDYFSQGNAPGVSVVDADTGKTVAQGDATFQAAQQSSKVATNVPVGVGTSFPTAMKNAPTTCPALTPAATSRRFATSPTGFAVYFVSGELYLLSTPAPTATPVTEPTTSPTFVPVPPHKPGPGPLATHQPKGGV